MKKKFSISNIRDYIPIIISFIILVILVIGLIFTINIKFDEKNATVDTSSNDNYISLNIEDLALDIQACDGDTTGPDDAKKVTFDYKTEWVFDRQEYDMSAATADTKELTDLPLIDVDTMAFDITLSNITDKLKVVITNDFDDEVVNINYSDTTNGTYVYQTKNTNDIIRYTVSIYSSSCNNLYREFEVLMPKYNYYSDYDRCKYVTSYYCQKLVTSDFSFTDFSINTNDEYEKNYQKAVEEEAKKENNSIRNILSNNYIMFIVIAVILIILIIVFITLRFKRKRGK